MNRILYIIFIFSCLKTISQTKGAYMIMGIDTETLSNYYVLTLIDSSLHEKVLLSEKRKCSNGRRVAVGKSYYFTLTEIFTIKESDYNLRLGGKGVMKKNGNEDLISPNKKLFYSGCIEALQYLQCE